jgi:hypothetical protein
VDFGDAAAPADFAAIYGTVFEDADGDGVWDVEEIGIPGVIVTLDGTVTTTTGIYGSYSFSTPVAGGHTVVKADRAGYYATTPTSVPVNVVLGNSYRVDFGDAVKAFQEARISIKGDATNEVGDEHTFTVTVEKNYGDPAVWVPAAGETVVASAIGAGGITGGTCQSGATDSAGQCTVLVNSDNPGQTTVSATSTVTLEEGGVSISTPAPAIKTWVDSRISITGDATNQVDDAHTFTVRVEMNEGGGWLPAGGVRPAITFPDGAPGTVEAGDCEVIGTGADGACLVVINSSVSGAFAAHAAADIPAGGLVLHRETDGQNGNSGDAVKIYLGPSISIIKTAGDAADGEVHTIRFSAEPVLVTYHYLVTNSGDTLLDDLTITDDHGTPDDTGDDVTLTSAECTSLAGPLAPGESASCTADLLVAGDVTNMAVATAHPIDEDGADRPGMDDPTGEDDAVVDMEAGPQLVVDKRLAEMDTDDEYPNYVTFTIAIENAGPSAIDLIPLADEFDPRYLSFVWAEPAPEEAPGDGPVYWVDLTAEGPGGFGFNLAHGEVFTLTTVFMVLQDITSTTNVAIVRDAVDVYDNPVPEAEDDEVIIAVPTAVELLTFSAVPAGDGILLEWETAMEQDNWGFNLYRGLVPDLGSAEWIHFEPGLGWGRFDGRQYDYTDLAAAPGQTVYYWLENIDLSDRTNLLGGPVMTMLAPHRIFLPIVLR